MDHSQDVTQLEAERQQLLDKMEALKSEFLEAVSEWLHPWFEVQLRQIVAAEPQLAEKLGKDGLRALKDKVAQLQERTREIVTTEVGAKRFWWHAQQKHPLREEEKNGYWTPVLHGEPKIPWRQSVAMRYAAGHLWPILKEAGYLVRQGTSPLDQKGRWGNWPSFTTPPAANDRPYYPHSLRGLPPRMEELMERYDALIPQVEAKERVIASMSHSSEREAALKLFDEA